MRIGSFTLRHGRPAIMGVVNVTPDSFSDGGRFVDPACAIEHALRLADCGADLLDIGGESTRPGADPVDTGEELERVIPVIEGVRRASRVPISIDTTKAAVGRAALDAGADMLNDISAGRFDAGMLPLAAESGVPICLMHMQGMPRTMQAAPHYGDLIGEIQEFLADAINRAVAAGVNRGAVAVDPGIGFGKDARDNIVILKRLAEFARLEAPILIGTSRKSFIGKMLDLDVDKRLEGTLATLAVAIEGGAAIIRVHDVAATARFMKMYLALRA